MITADDASIVIAHRASLVRRKMRFYLSPLLIAEPEQSFTHRTPLGRIKFGPTESEYANWVQTLGDRNDLETLTGCADFIPDSLAHQKPGHGEHEGNRTALGVRLALCYDTVK